MSRRVQGRDGQRVRGPGGSGRGQKSREGDCRGGTDAPYTLSVVEDRIEAIRAHQCFRHQLLLSPPGRRRQFIASRLVAFEGGRSGSGHPPTGGQVSSGILIVAERRNSCRRSGASGRNRAHNIVVEGGDGNPEVERSRSSGDTALALAARSCEDSRGQRRDAGAAERGGFENH